MRKIVLLLILLAILTVSGCPQAINQVAAKQPEKSAVPADCPIKTPGYAVSPQGECSEFKNFCQIPNDYNVVASCGQFAANQKGKTEAGSGGAGPGDGKAGATGTGSGTGVSAEADLCADMKCDDACDGTTFRSGGKCLAGKCYYLSSKLNALQCGGTPIEAKYDFNASMEKCVYNKISSKYTVAYRIRNTTDNIPPKQSKIWLFAPALNYAMDKTVQREYAKNQVMWEEQGITLVDTYVRGQYWEFGAKTGDYNFTLIFCEPEFAAKEKCNPETGVIVATGNTKKLCPELESIDASELNKYKQKYMKQDT